MLPNAESGATSTVARARHTGRLAFGRQLEVTANPDAIRRREVIGDVALRLSAESTVAEIDAYWRNGRTATSCIVSEGCRDAPPSSFDRASPRPAHRRRDERRTRMRWSPGEDRSDTPWFSSIKIGTGASGAATATPRTHEGLPLFPRRRHTGAEGRDFVIQNQPSAVSSGVLRRRSPPRDWSAPAPPGPGFTGFFAERWHGVDARAGAGLDACAATMKMPIRVQLLSAISRRRWVPAASSTYKMPTQVMRISADADASAIFHR